MCGIRSVVPALIYWLHNKRNMLPQTHVEIHVCTHTLFVRVYLCVVLCSVHVCSVHVCSLHIHHLVSSFSSAIVFFKLCLLHNTMFPTQHHASLVALVYCVGV